MEMFCDAQQQFLTLSSLPRYSIPRGPAKSNARCARAGHNGSLPPRASAAVTAVLRLLAGTRPSCRPQDSSQHQGRRPCRRPFTLRFSATPSFWQIPIFKEASRTPRREKRCPNCADAAVPRAHATYRSIMHSCSRARPTSDGPQGPKLELEETQRLATAVAGLGTTYAAVTRGFFSMPLDGNPKQTLFFHEQTSHGCPHKLVPPSVVFKRAPCSNSTKFAQSGSIMHSGSRPVVGGGGWIGQTTSA